MKRTLIAAGLAVLFLAAGFVAYAVWFVRRAALDRVEVRASARPLQEQRLIEIEVATLGTDDLVAITVISMDRSLQEALGLSPPAGFKVEPLPLEDREKGDEESAAFVAQYNREKIRYTGRLPVAPGTPAVLRFPAERPTAATGLIQLQHERAIGVGGSIAFVSVPVGITQSVIPSP